MCTFVVKLRYMEYLDYTQEDANQDGIEYAISKYSKKILKDGLVIGRIVFQDEQLHIDETYIENANNEEKKTYYLNLKKVNSIRLRKISFLKEYRFSGEIENLFDYIATKIIPTDFVIWCYEVFPLRSYVKQIGGFNSPLYKLPNKKVLLFSVDV